MVSAQPKPLRPGMLLRPAVLRNRGGDFDHGQQGPGIRCACCSDAYSAEFSRLHNDVNMLALGARVVGPGLAIKLVEIFLTTEFEGGRHKDRVDLIMDLDARSER